MVRRRTGWTAGCSLSSWQRKEKAAADPALFATYAVLADHSSETVVEHLRDLVAQLTTIIVDGIGRGEFAETDPSTAAQAVFDATVVFRSPLHSWRWTIPTIDAEFAAVRKVILNGLVQCRR